MSQHRYLDVMTIRSSNGSSKLIKDGKSSLLLEPVHLPEMVHVHVDPARGDSQDSRFFYATGEKNPNLNKHIENAYKSTTYGNQEPIVQSTVSTTVRPRNRAR